MYNLFRTTEMYRAISNSLHVTLILAALTACTALPEPTDPAELEKTWHEAAVMLPVSKSGYTFLWKGVMKDKKVRDGLTAIAERGGAPVIVYLHGCSAAGWFSSVHLMERFVEHGYIVVGPNSYARSGRQSACGTGNWWVYRGRQAELNYATEKLSTMDWADSENLFLIGHSEGGEVASRYQDAAFKGIVISAASCSKGVSASEATKVLSVSAAGDDTGNGARRDCPGADEWFEIPGTMHNVLGNSEVSERVFEFVTNLTDQD